MGRWNNLLRETTKPRRAREMRARRFPLPHTSVPSRRERRKRTMSITIARQCIASALSPSHGAASTRRPARTLARAEASTSNGVERSYASSRRRVMILGLTAASALVENRASAIEANELENSAFVAELKRKSDEKREERKQERLDNYNKKNFGDYLDWVAGNDALKDDSQLSENDRAIRAYLKSIKN